MTYTAQGKLYARMVYREQRQWPEEVPVQYRDECWDAYTNFYQYKPGQTNLSQCPWWRREFMNIPPRRRWN